jgi:DNA-binding transcriptional LysR family regulator
VTRLESRLKLRLLHRSTRSLTLTEAGRELYERASVILGALEETESVLERSHAEPQGLLRLTCGEEFGALVVTQWMADYMKAHAAVQVQAELTNRVLDLVHEGFDLAIRVGNLPDSSLSARMLGEIGYGFYASPAYLRSRQLPMHPEHLENHDLLVFGAPGTGWPLIRRDETLLLQPKARFSANNNMAVRACAAQGLGIALLPHFQARPLVARKALKPVLPEWGRRPVPVHALFASSRYLSPKVRGFVDLATHQFDTALESVTA